MVANTSVAEVKALLQGVGEQFEDLRTQLQDGGEEFQGYATYAEDVLQGTNSSVETDVVDSIKRAYACLETASDACMRAAQACERWVDGH